MTKENITTYAIKRYDRLYGEQSNFRSLWQDIADLMHPRKSNAILGQESPGTGQTEKLFESTAIHCNELLAASMNSALTSAAVKWFSLKIRGLNSQDKVVSDWLEDCSQRMYRALQESNFNSEIHECYLDLGAFGTSPLEIMESDIEAPGFNGLRFKAYSIGEYVVDEDANGRVNVIIRKFTMGAKAAFDKWGKDVGEAIEKWATDEPERPVEILHAILPARELGLSGVIQKYASVYLDYSKKHLISMGGFREMPVPVARWAKSSGEKYGRGPGFTALPNVKRLNRAVELGLRAWAKAIDPPLGVLDNGVIGSIRMQPSGITYMRDLKAVQPIESRSRFDVSQIKEEDLRKLIREIFFSDQLQFQETPQMTATEVYVRYELMQRLLGPTLGRLESEMLNPIVERVFALMLRAGAFLPVPPQLARYRQLDIEYEGPMARAMRASDMVAIQRTMEIVSPLATVAPEILDWYDMDKIAKFVPQVTGMQSALLRDDAEVRAIREERAKQQQAEQAKQDLMNIAEGAKNIAPLIQAGASL